MPILINYASLLNYDINPDLKFLYMSTIKTMAETNSKEIPEGNPDQSKNECPHVTISLKAKPASEEIDELSILEPDPDVFQSLYQEQQVLGSKLSALRMAYKANIISQMREVPEINENSRKIVESLNHEAETFLLTSKNELKAKKNSKSSRKCKKTGKNDKKVKRNKKKQGKKLNRNKYDSILNNPMSPELFKHSKSLEFLDLPSPQSPSSPKSVIDRTQYWKEERDKRVADKKREKEIHDMLECTFTPHLYSKTEVNDTGSVITKSKTRLSFRPFSPLSSVSFKQEYPSRVDLFSCAYSQISPVSVKVVYESGYNHKEFVAKAKPMACYQMDNSDDSF